MIIPARDALQAIDTILGPGGDWTPIERRHDTARKMSWHHTRVPGAHRRFADHIITQDERWNAEVAFALPRRQRWAEGPVRSTVLWVMVSGADQVKRATRLRPAPTFAIREGSSSRRWLFWWLEEPIFILDAEQRNRRLAYAVRATQKHGRDTAWFPAPGTFGRVGRSRPAPITCSRLTPASYEPDAVTAHLKEPPDPGAWRKS